MMNDGRVLTCGWAEAPSRSFLIPVPSTFLPSVGCRITDPRPVGTEEFVFSQIPSPHLNHARFALAVESRREGTVLGHFYSTERVQPQHISVRVGIKCQGPTVLQSRLLHGLSLDNAGIIPRCRNLRHPRLQRSHRPLTGPRVLIHDSSPRTPTLPKGQTNYRSCRLLESEGG
jgi:hypothetical protein